MSCRSPKQRLWCRACAWIVAALLGGAGQARGQTFAQLTDLGSNLGPRLTRAVTQQRLNRSLFGSIGTKVTFIDNGTVYQFASDPTWARILSGRMDYWVREHDNRAGPGGRLAQPLGIDISARKYFYAADRDRGFVFLARFSTLAQSLIEAAVWSAPQFSRPVDVAWDGRTAPLTDDYLYVLDDSSSQVSYWNRPTLLWTYGTPGSSVGQFSRPSGICVGKTAAANGGTQFTTSFYVVDRGNRRVVWLERGASGATWMGTAALPNWDPTDCAVDHFGNLFVADEFTHRIHKFTSSLAQLSDYGTYGKGATNFNTFAFPHAISVPCGLKVVNSQTVWYCEGRVITAELWSDSTGAVEHYLGLELSRTSGPDNAGFITTLGYFATDHSYHTVSVKDASTGNTVRLLYPNILVPPGNTTVLWDGYRGDGTPAPPGYYYFFVSTLSGYGCNAHSWCDKRFDSPPFLFCPQASDTNPALVRPDPCDPEAAARVGADLLGNAPSDVFMRQRVFAAARPLTRASSLAASAPDVRATTSEGSLTTLVREYGVRGLSFGVPRSASNQPVTIRVYTLAGRPIRTLVSEGLDPGYYELAWDGLDDRGRAAAPGVYFAVLTAAGQRVVQRLILRQTP